MKIILEGPDGSGKSTLARLIGQYYKLYVIQGTGPEKYFGEMAERLAKYESQYRNDDFVFDRHPIISHPIYSRYSKTDMSRIDPKTIARFWESKPLIIYCRGAEILDNHEVDPEKDTPEHLELLADFHQNICRDYDQWGLDRADIIYDFRRTDSKRVLELIRGVYNAQRYL